MNHIYKVIWNTITQTWVAVSELSRAKGKTKSSKTLSAVVLAAVSAGAIVGDAEAAYTEGVGKGIAISLKGGALPADAKKEWSIAIGTNASAENGYDIAIGGHSHAKSKDTRGAEGKLLEGSAIAIGKETKATGQGTIAIGRKTLAEGEYGSAYGAQASAGGNSSSAFGFNANASAAMTLAAGVNSKATKNHATALGEGATASGDAATALGQASTASGENAFAAGVSATASKGNSVAIGKSASSSGDNSISIGTQSASSANHTISMGTFANASKDQAISIGYTSEASGINATSIGVQSLASNKNSSATGYNAQATGESSTATGDSSVASGSASVATGKSATAKGSNTIAIGNAANADGTDSIASGRQASATGTGAIATGAEASASGNAAAYGNQAKANGGRSSAFGNESKATGGWSSAFGNQSEATATDASAFGNTAIAAAQDSTAVGAHSSVTSVATGGTALGRSSSVTTAGGVALGQGSSSSRTALDPNHVQINDKNIDKSTGISQDSEKISDVYSPVKLIDDPEVLKRVKNTIHGNAGAVSLGKDGETTRQLTNLAPGSADSDAVNVAQLKAVVGTIKHYNVTSKDGDIIVSPDTTDPNKTVWDLKINPTYKIKYFSVNSTKGTNEDNKGATGKDAIAIGKDAASSANNAVVIGKSATALKNDEQYDLNVGKAKSNADSAVVIGNGATSKQARTVAIGNAATTLHTSAIAIGDKAYSNGARGIAIGRNAQSTGNNSIALGAGDQNDGNKTEASKDHAVAIGSGAVANIANGIALGSQSKTTVASGQTGFDASQDADGARVNKYANLTNNNQNVRTSTLAGFSIGDAAKTRQINHLAAGTADDDAVNVAQLKSVNLAFKGDNNTKGDVRLHDQRLSVVGVENSFITTKAGDNKLEIGTTQGTFSTTDGKSSAPKQGLATTTTVASAINDSGWEVRAKGTKVGLVNPGDKVDFTNADKSIEIESFAEANGLSTIKFKAVTETIQTEEKSPITQIDVNGSTVSKTTKGKNEPTGRFVVPTGDKANKYALATAYDVADKVNQTGWNLYTNGGARSLINPGDYVNFKSGNATNAKVVTEASEGATISYDVNVDNTTIKIDSNGNKLTANTGDVDSVTNTEGTSKKGQVTIHKDPLEPSKTDSGKLATVDTVVKAVNNAKWFTIAKDSDDKVTGETKTNESEGTAMAAGETLGLNAGKNLRLKREANTNNFTFALDSNLKDLDSVHTKEIKLGESNNPISIKNDGDRITYTTKGGNNSDVTHKVANLEDEKHIKPTTDGNEYTVDASGNITMTYADGNNKDVTNTKAVIKGVAKNDLSNITNDGKKAITTLGSVVKAGDNVLVDEDTDAITGKKTYTVNAVTPVVYTDKQGNRVYKVKDGNGYKFTKNADGTGEVVNKSDVIASFYDGNSSATAGTMIVNNIGSAIKNVTVPADKDANNFLNKLEVAASSTGTPNAAVNVSDLHNTADALRSNEIHIAPTTDKAEGKEATHYKYDADKKQVVMTYQDGKGNDVANKKAVIDLSSLADSVHNYGFKANATGNGSTGASAQDVANGTTVNFDAGKNLTVKQTVDATSKNHTYSFALSNNVDLTSAGSITMGDTKVDNSGITINATTPAAGETKKPDVTLTNTGLSNGDNHITNVKGNLPSTQNNTASGDNAQSNATKSKEAPNITGTGDNAVNVNNAATVGDVLNAGWNLQGNGSEIDFVKPYDTVNFANGTGTTATVTNTDGKTTTVKYDVAVGKGLEVDGDNKVTVKTDGDTITVGEDGKLKASLSTEKVKAATGDDNIATVTPSTTDTSKYGEKGATYEVAVTKSAVKKVAKTAVKVAAGDNVIVSSADNQAGDETTYTVEAVTPVVYTDKQGNRVYKVKDGNGYKFTKNADGTGEVVNKSDVIASFYDGNSSATAGTMIVNNIGSAIKNVTVPADKDANNFLNKLEVAASSTGTPNAAVNVSDLHNTADALRSNEIHIAPTTDKAEGKEATHYKYDADKKQVVMTYQDGKGNDVANKKAVIDLSSLADSVHNYGFKANATGNGSTGASAQDVANGTTVNFDAGKNLTVKQTVDATSKNHTYSFALKDDVVIGAKGENGKDGIDGSIGVNGKDGSAVAINGKDGSIGLNGENGKNGLTIKGDKGAVGVDGTNGKDGKDGMTRIVYTDNNNVKHEVATLDDGVKYAGDDAQPGDGQTEHQKDKVIAKKLNNIIDIIGGADKDKLSDKNIGVNNVDGKLKVQLAKELKGLTSAEFNDGKDKTKTEITHNGIAITPVNPANGKTSVTLTDEGLNNGGNTITNVAEGKNGTDAVNVNQLNKVEAKITEGGLTFAGNSGTDHKAKLNSTVNIKGAEGNTDANQFDNGKNVMTAVNGNTVTVSIKKTPEVEGINITDKTGNVKVKLTQTDEGLKVSDGDNNETRITNVKAGEKDTDAVNVKQLNAAKTKVTAGDNIDVTSSTDANGQTIYKVSAKGINDTSAAVKAGSNHVEVTKAANTHKDGSTTVTDYTVDLSEETKNTIRDTHKKVTDEGLTFNADKGTTTGVKKLGSSVAVNGDGKNITTTANKNGVTVSMNNDIKVNSVTAQKVKVGDVNINENGINAGGKRITNVAPGKDGTDAVNVNQLKYVAGNISNQINNVDKGLRAGIAGALASGGLYHVTTAGKSMVSVGAGTYRGQNALAVGYSRLSDNGKVGVKFTVNSNSQGHAGASASVGYQW